MSDCVDLGTSFADDTNIATLARAAAYTEIIDEEFVNNPDIWPRLSSGLINSICNGPGQYMPVPMLKSKNEAYLPLQVFPDAASLVTGSVLKMDANQERVLTRDTSKHHWLRRMQKAVASMLNRNRPAEPTCKVHFQEEYRGKSHGDGFTLDQRITRFHSAHATDLDHDHATIRNIGRFRLKFTGIHYRTISPHALLDCRLPPGSPILRMLVKKFYIIYDTCVAREIQCMLKQTMRDDRRQKVDLDYDDYVDKERVVRLKSCPIAFRCVQATIGDDGVIVDLRFHVHPREVLSFDDKVKYAVLSPEMLIHLEAPTANQSGQKANRKKKSP